MKAQEFCNMAQSGMRMAALETYPEESLALRYLEDNGDEEGSASMYSFINSFALQNNMLMICLACMQLFNQIKI